MANQAVPNPAVLPAGAESAPAQLNRRVISGSIWTVSGYGASQLLRLLSNLAFARLLFPEAFGLLALVNIFVQGLTMFSDIGIGPSIIQSRRGEELVFLNTAWTIQVVRGFALWAVSLACAAPFAAWYEQPLLARMIPIAALASIISGFASTKQFTATRRIAVARLTVLDLASQTLGLATMVVWCWFSRDVWAIVYGGLVQTAAKTVLTHVALSGERNRFAFDREAARGLMSFGRWVFLSTALWFLAMQADRLMLGKFVPLGLLGIYSIAMTFASLAPMIAGQLTSTVLFPLLSHHSRTDEREYESMLRKARSFILEGSLFMLAGLALLSPAFFHLLYDQRYADAAWMAQWLTVPMWGWVLMLSAGCAVLAAGESRTLAIAHAATLLGKVGACILGFQIAGLVGFILGLALGHVAGHIPFVLSLRRRGIHILNQDLAYTSLGIAAVGGGVFVQRVVFASLEGKWRGLAELGVSLLVVVPLGLRSWKSAKATVNRG